MCLWKYLDDFLLQSWQQNSFSSACSCWWSPRQDEHTNCLSHSKYFNCNTDNILHFHVNFQQHPVAFITWKCKILSVLQLKYLLWNFTREMNLFKNLLITYLLHSLHWSGFSPCVNTDVYFDISWVIKIWITSFTCIWFFSWMEHPLHA